MEKFVKFIECNIPGKACNMKCSYCYVSQLNKISTKDVTHFTHSPEHIGYSLRKERIGGTAYINICGLGETLIPKDIIEIIYNILKQGHYVNVYTNGTLTKRFQEVANLPKSLLSHLSFSFSFHYLELIRLNKLDIFFKNFNYCKNLGCTVICNMVLDDSYLPHIKQIKELTLKEIGAYPQISLAKKANKDNNYSNLNKDIEKIHTIGKTFSSPYFDFTEKYYNYDRKKFCYAGKWSFNLNLANGNVSKCYSHPIELNIYENTECSIDFLPVGRNCISKSCGGGLLLPMGIVPDIKTPTYAFLKNRAEANWYNKEYLHFLSQQLYENNIRYTKSEEYTIDIINYLKKSISNIKHKFKKTLSNISNK